MRRLRYHVIGDLVRERGWMSGAELGVYKGDTLFHLLDTFPALRMVGVDNWNPVSGIGKDKMSGDTVYDPTLVRKYHTDVLERAQAYGPRCRIIEDDTAVTANQFLDGVFDFVFIDADHRPAAVARDVFAWLRKVKPGGALLGHDAGWPSVQRGLAASLPGQVETLEANVWKWEVVR